MEESTLLSVTLKTFKKFYWLIILTMIIGGIAGRAIASKGPAPSYQANVSIFLKQKQPENVEKQFDDYPRFMNTAILLAKTPVVLDNAIKEAKLKLTANEIQNQITVTNENGSEILNIQVNHEDQTVAPKLANAIAHSLQVVLPKYLDVDTVQIIDPAEEDEVSEILLTRTNEMMVMGVIIGMIIGTILAFILNYMKKK